MIPKIVLKKRGINPCRFGSPWIFLQNIEYIPKNISAGQLVEVYDGYGKFIGKGFFSPSSSIPVRILSYEKDEEIDKDWFYKKIDSAIKLRKFHNLPNEETTGYRLINGEGDGLPGLIVDIYGDKAVIYFGTIGMKLREKLIIDILTSLLKIRSIFEVTSPGEQSKERIEAKPSLIRGSDPFPWYFKENGLELWIELPQGQKTGYYLDQRENRLFIRNYVKDKEVLDLFTYTGGFALNAALAKAKSVLAIDSSMTALLHAEKHAYKNGLKDKIKFFKSEIKSFLQELVDQEKRFDFIIMDPPKLMTSQSSRESALKGYRYLNSMAMRLIRPEGYLATCSCSGRLSLDEFLKTLGESAQLAKREIQVITIRGAGVDHPSPPGFKQGRYLKFVLLRIL